MSNTDIIDSVRRGALEQETYILDIFKQHDLSNPKKVGKLAARLLREEPNLSRLQRKLLTDVWSARNPAKQAKHFISIIEDCAIIMKQFVDDGSHGMIITHDHITYPVKLDTNSSWLRPDDPWDEGDEIDIQHKIVHNWMVENKINHFLGKVVLFPMFGFSGVPRLVQMKYTHMTDDHVKLEGTPYYKKETGNAAHR